MKLYYIDRLETKLCKAEIEARLRDIVLEDKFFNIFTKGKKLYHAEFKENIFSFFYLSRYRRDMLSPRIHMTILEKDEGCICDLYYSKTRGFLYLLIFWSIYVGGFVYDSVLRSNVFWLICYIVVYILVIWIAQEHYHSICKKVVNILKEQLDII